MKIRKFNEEIDYKENGFKNIRFIVNYDEEKTKKAQELAFNYGYKWYNGYKNFLYLTETYELDFDTKDKYITYSDEYIQEDSEYFDDFVIVNYLDDLEIYFKTNGKGNQFLSFYNKKRKYIYENKKTIDLFVFEAKSDNDVIKAQEYAFKNGYTWYGGGSNVSYTKISHCKYFFYELEDKKLTISSDLEDKSYEEFIKEYYSTENFVIVNDIKALEQNLKTGVKSFHNFYNNKRLVYESIEDGKTDYVIYKPKTADECIELQKIAFENGWVWDDGSTQIMNTTAKILFFKLSDKDITYSPIEQEIEDIIMEYRDEYDEILKGSDNINVIKNFLRTYVFNELTFDEIYGKNRMVYESIKPGIKYIDFLLPTNLDEKQKYVNILEKKGWVKKQVNGNNVIVNNLEDANILHIFTGEFDKDYLLIKDENGIDNFINTHLYSYLDNVLKITNKKEFYDTFDESLINIFNYFDKKNIYD